MRFLWRYVDRFFRPFDVPNIASKNWLLVATIMFVILIAVISGMFLQRAFAGASAHDFWTDERNGMSTRAASYSDLITGNLASQASRAPLDYIVEKLFDEVGGRLLSAGMPPNIYYRLNSIFYIWLSGLFIMLLIFFRIRRDARNYLVLLVQIIFLASALYHYYFWHENFRYWIQMRPYALWCALWFMILTLFFVDGRLKVWPFTVLFTLLAATATAAIYQLFSFGLAFAIVQLIRKEKCRDIMLTGLKVFLIPMIVSLYYILIDRSTIYGWTADADQYIKEFFHFWLTKEMIPILSVLGILITVWIKELRNHTIVFLAIFILYLISPLINYAVVSRGIFFSSRHYLYYDLIYAVFLSSMAMVMPVYLEKIRKAA